MDNLITEDSMNLAEAMARKYAKNDEDLYDELRAEGYLGLTVAASKFDESRNVKFTTYAYYWVRKYILSYLEGHPLSEKSLDEIIDDEEGYSVALSETLEDENVNVENEAIKNIEIEEMLNAISNLNKKEQDIIIRHYGLYNTYPETIKEIAKTYGTSPQNISQIEKGALKKVKKAVG